ncbi:hypothetical protein [Vibrio sp. WXL103]|uniref:hypothetical protein n=1 Tax=unclassified Vibrio TaxID=2614977 RepID=UPI003EC7F2F6
MEIVFNTWIERDPKVHNASVDFNDSWTRAHMGAFLRGSGSRSENIVKAFVSGDYMMIPSEFDLISAWHHLDRRQQNLVKALRLEMVRSAGYPKEEKALLQYFFNNMCGRVYNGLCYDWDERNNNSDMPFNINHELANQATRTVKEAVLNNEETDFDLPFFVIDTGSNE